MGKDNEQQLGQKSPDANQRELILQRGINKQRWQNNIAALLHGGLSTTIFAFGTRILLSTESDIRRGTGWIAMGVVWGIVTGIGYWATKRHIRHDVEIARSMEPNVR